MYIERRRMRKKRLKWLTIGAILDDKDRMDQSIRNLILG